MTVEEFAQIEKAMYLTELIEPRLYVAFPRDVTFCVANFVLDTLINRLCTLGDIDFCRQFLTSLNVWFEYIDG